MADTLDVLTLEEAKEALNMTVDTHGPELARFVTAVSRKLDDLVGPVVNRTVSNELHDGGRPVIFPKQTPVSSVTTLVEYVSTTGTTLSAESNASKPASGFLLVSDGHDCRIVRRSGGATRLFASGASNVDLTYVAGRAADTDSVDDKFKVAAGIMLQHLWRPSAGAWAQATDAFYETEAPARTPGFGVPRAVLELLADELPPPVVF